MTSSAKIPPRPRSRRIAGLRAAVVVTLLVAAAAFSGTLREPIGGPSAASAARSDDCNQNGRPDRFDVPHIAFVGLQSVSVGREVQSVTSGDLDGDGDVDLATMTDTGSTISIVLNGGNGDLQAATNIRLGGRHGFIRADDVDDDDDRDLVVLAPGILSVLKNIGNAQFAPAAVYPTGVEYTPTRFELADLDDDGAPDVAFLGSPDSYLPEGFFVFWNDGTGAFRLRQNFAFGESVSEFRLGDVTGDGLPDVAATDFPSDHVLISDNLGGRMFASPRQIGTQPSSTAFVLADMDADDDLDLTVTDPFPAISIHPNAGNGSFGPATFYPGIQLSEPLAVDLDRDMLPDLIGNLGFSGGARVVRNLGDGKFAVPVIYAARGEIPVDAADFDLDLVPDMLLRSDSGFSIMRGNGDATLAAPVEIPLSFGVQPLDVAATDLDADDDRDLVVAYRGFRNEILVLRNRGDGSFVAQPAISVGQRPTSIAIADLTGDGRPDLAVANGESGSVSVLRNTGNLRFAALATLQPGFGVSSVKALDVDDDDDVDLFVGGTKLAVFRNNGSGTFAAAELYEAEGKPAIADLDGDGDPDVAYSDRTKVIVLFNDGGGHLDPQSASFDDFDDALLAPADVDGDQDIDLVAAFRYSAAVVVFMNDGAGEFTANQMTGPAASGWPLAFDADGDADLDLAIPTSTGFETLQNAGAGTFRPGVEHPINQSLTALAAIDLDGDPVADIAGVSFDAGKVVLFRNLTEQPVSRDDNGDGIPDECQVGPSPTPTPVPGAPTASATASSTPSASRSASATATPPPTAKPPLTPDHDCNRNAVSDLAEIADGSLGDCNANQVPDTCDLGLNRFAAPVTVAMGTNAVVADFDRDGDPDLATLNVGEPRIQIWRNAGDGTFAANGEISLGATFVIAANAADFDGDGDMDLAIGTSGPSAIDVVLNRGDGTFDAPNRTHIPLDVSLYEIHVAEITGDELPDLVIPDPRPTGGTIALLRNAGPAGWSALPSIPIATTGFVATLALADVDADDDIDVVVSDFGQSVTVFQNDGSGAFPTSFDLFAGIPVTAIAVADLDSDGAAELIAGSSDHPFLLVFRNDSGTYDPPQLLATSVPVEQIVVAPVHGDPRPDLLVSNSDVAGVSVLRNRGDLQFDAPRLFDLIGRDAMLRAVDVDVDGDVDLISVLRLQDVIQVVRNDGRGQFGAPSMGTAGHSPSAVAAGDLDGDGHADLAIANKESDDVSVLLNDGLGACQLTLGFGVGNAPNAIALADLDGDKDIDAVTADLEGATLSLLRNRGDGTFHLAEFLAVEATTPYAIAIHLDDFDGDDDQDIAVASNVSRNGGLAGCVSVLENDGLGTFESAPCTRIQGQAVAITGGDFDGDDAPEIAVAGAAGLVMVRYAGDGTLDVGDPIHVGDPIQGFSLAAVSAAHLDADDRLDLVGSMDFADAIVTIFNRGEGRFETVIVEHERGCRRVAPGDTDGDGDVDLACSTVSGVDVLRNDGLGRFVSEGRYYPGDIHAALVVHDFDGDGIGDIATAPGNILRSEPLAAVSEDANGNSVPDECDDDITPATVISATPTATAVTSPSSTRPPTPTATPFATASPTPSTTSTSTPTATGSASATATASATPSARPCAGDCDGDGLTVIAELIRGVRLALGQSATPCDAIDRNLDGNVDIAELIGAVGAALVGCPAPAELEAAATAVQPAR